MLSQYPVGVEDDAPGDVIHGSLSQNNNPVPNNDAPITVTDLASLAYNGGALTGNDDLWFRANDGAQWGGWVRTRITDPGDSPPATTATPPPRPTTLFSASE